MADIVLLDACILIKYNLTSVLLYLAEQDLFEPRWSVPILEETRRNLVKDLEVSADAADRRLSAMNSAFPEAQVDDFEWLIPAMANHPKDRHVLAAAVATEANVIVTENLKDFPHESLAPHDIEVLHPDEYLLRLWATDQDACASALATDAANRRRPPNTSSSILAAIAGSAPTFANLLNQYIQSEGPREPLRALVAARPHWSPFAAGDTPDLTDPLQVATLWWSALLHPDEYRRALLDLTHAPRAFDEFAWAAEMVEGLSLASKVYIAVDALDADIAIMRFVPEVAQTSQVFAAFRVDRAIFLTLIQYTDGTWRVWGLGPRIPSATQIKGEAPRRRTTKTQAKRRGES